MQGRIQYQVRQVYENTNRLLMLVLVRAFSALAARLTGLVHAVILQQMMEKTLNEPTGHHFLQGKNQVGLAGESRGESEIEIAGNLCQGNIQVGGDGGTFFGGQIGEPAGRRPLAEQEASAGVVERTVGGGSVSLSRWFPPAPSG